MLARLTVWTAAVVGVVATILWVALEAIVVAWAVVFPAPLPVAAAIWGALGLPLVVMLWRAWSRMRRRVRR